MQLCSDETERERKRAAVPLPHSVAPLTRCVVVCDPMGGCVFRMARPVQGSHVVYECQHGKHHWHVTGSDHHFVCGLTVVDNGEPRRCDYCWLVPAGASERLLKHAALEIQRLYMTHRSRHHKGWKKRLIPGLDACAICKQARTIKSQHCSCSTEPQLYRKCIRCGAQLLPSEQQCFSCHHEDALHMHATISIHSAAAAPAVAAAAVADAAAATPGSAHRRIRRRFIA